MGCAVSGLTWLCLRVEHCESLKNSSELWLCTAAYPSWASGPFFELLSPKDREVVWMGSEEPTCLSWVQIISWNKPELGKLFFSKWLFPQEPDPKAVGLCKS